MSRYTGQNHSSFVGGTCDSQEKKSDDNYVFYPLFLLGETGRAGVA
jgi:hypothetical protein